jgi:hypothetical protein
MHYLSLIYYTTQPQHVSSTFTAHHQEVFAVHVQQLVCHMQCFFSNKMFRGTLSLTQENHLVSLNMTKHICCQHTIHKTVANIHYIKLLPTYAT